MADTDLCDDCKKRVHDDPVGFVIFDHGPCLICAACWYKRQKLMTKPEEEKLD